MSYPFFKLALLLTTISGIVVTENAFAAYNIYLSEEGVYSLSLNDLNIHHKTNSMMAFKNIRLKSNGTVLKFWLNDDGDGLWEGDENIIFIAKKPLSASLGNENFVYQLQYFQSSHIDYIDTSEVVYKYKDQFTKDKPNFSNEFIRVISDEKNNFRVSLTDKQADISESQWFWGQFSSYSQSPFEIELNVNHIKSEEHEVKLMVGLRSLSQSPDSADINHSVRVFINGNNIGELNWNGQTDYQGEKYFSSNLINNGSNEISFEIDKVSNDSENKQIDVVYLDKIELAYEFNEVFKGQQIKLKPKSLNNQLVKVNLDMGVEFFTEKGQVIKFPEGTGKAIFKLEDEMLASPLYWVNKKAYKKPLDIKLTNNIPLDYQDIEYLIVTHPDYIEDLKKFVNFKQSSALKVMMVDTQTVYDNFANGTVSVLAIRKAIREIYTASNEQLKYVLLVGDASWSMQNQDKLIRNDNDDSTVNLLPTWQKHTRFGTGASDAPFADLDDDGIPDLAIGRFAAGDKQQLLNMINKTINYQKNEKFNIWKTKLSMLSPQSRLNSAKTLKILNGIDMPAKTTVDHVFNNKESSQVTKQQQVIKAINNGQVLLHFYGHGGRFMWDVGVDIDTGKAQHFTMEHVAQLRNETLPVILNMTCASGPFDHPNVGSIAEELVSMPDHGAVAVIASSTRNIPKKIFSRALIDRLMNGFSAGEALMLAKQQAKDSELGSVYNLLGDPSLKLELPDYEIELNFDEDTGLLEILIPFNKIDKGKVIVIEQNDSLEIISRRKLVQVEKVLTIDVLKETKRVMVYAFDAAFKVDAFGQLELKPKKELNLSEKQH